jgi:hypothetical protein
MAPLLACVGLELGRVALVYATKPKWLFAIDPRWNWWLALTVIATLMSVAAPLKIWNNTRIEMNLERHQQLLLKARMDALSSQINPHFLFNTLNTVSALIRFDPDTARGVVLKLSNILRRLLRKHETFVPLHEELEFIDDYLDIEVARFGRDNLEIIKELDEDTLEAFVPSMLLQPIVENCLKQAWPPKSKAAKFSYAPPTATAACTSKLKTMASASPKKKCPTSTSKASASATFVNASKFCTAPTSTSKSKAAPATAPPSASTSPN